MARAVFEHHVERPSLAVDDDSPMAREIDGLWLPGPAVRHEDVRPAVARRGHLTHVEHDVGKVLEEDARANLALRARRDDRQR